VYDLGVPLPIAFWEVTSPTQVTFNLLPPGTEIPHPTISSLWGPPKMTGRIRFPLSHLVDVAAARGAISKAYAPGQKDHFLAVVWKWTDGQIQLAFFRSKSREVLGLGDTEPPDWFDPASVASTGLSKWERLMEDKDDD